MDGKYGLIQQQNLRLTSWEGQYLEWNLLRPARLKSMRWIVIGIANQWLMLIDTRSYFSQTDTANAKQWCSVIPLHDNVTQLSTTVKCWSMLKYKSSLISLSYVCIYTLEVGCWLMLVVLLF